MKNNSKLYISILILLTISINIFIFNQNFTIDNEKGMLMDPNNHKYIYQNVNQKILKSNSIEFISSWNTSITSLGSSNEFQVELPLEITGIYDFLVEWGDGTSNSIKTWNDPAATHTYQNQGMYTIKITGTLQGWCFDNGGDNLKLIEILQWGNFSFGNAGSYFAGCSNLILTAKDAPNLSITTNFAKCFYNCTQLGSIGNMELWETINITNMYMMFYNAFTFNQSIENWNVSNVTEMSYMFYNVSSFDQPISEWNIVNVQNMESMFELVELSPSNYDAILTNWSSLNVHNNVKFHAGMSRYTFLSVSARMNLVENHGWIISDGGKITIIPDAPVLMVNPNPSSTGNVTLTWNEIEFAESYTIYRNTSEISTVVGLTPLITELTNFSYNDTGLFTGTYYYVIVAINPDGISEISNCVNVEIEIPPVLNVPSPPRNFDANAGETIISLTWDSPLDTGGTPLVQYRIYKRLNDTTSVPTIFLISATLNSYTDTDVLNNTDYVYYITAVNSIGESEASNLSSATPLQYLTPPSSPEALRITSNDAVVGLEWLMPRDNGGSLILNYSIYRSTTSGSGFILVDTINSIIEIYTDLTVENGTTYYYQVTALNAIGESIPSNEVNTTVQGDKKMQNDEIDLNIVGANTILLNSISGMAIIYLLVHNRNRVKK